MRTAATAIALERFTTFGDLLKYLRRRTGLTQRELSIAVGYSDAQISRLEQNERLPDLATLTARFLPALHMDDQPEAALRLLDLAASMRREDAPAAGLPPYKGLRCFDETDAELFFGREALTQLLLERLAERLESAPRFLAVVGASGSGKSSVVRAGLIPALRWQPPSSGWPVITLTPTAHPLEALAAALAREARQGPEVQRSVYELARDPAFLPDSLRRVAQAARADHAILIVDQFEELFTLCRSAPEQSAFVDSLAAVAAHSGLRAAVVIVLRADFYAHCARFASLRQALSQHQEYIGPMTNTELRRVIVAPAQHGHWEFEPGLVDLMLQDVGALGGHTPEPGALPLLSHALLAVWQRRRGRMMTLGGYTASGGVRGAIAETAEAVFHDRLDVEQRGIARQIFLRLTELGGEAAAADTRRRASLAELVIRPADREAVQAVLITLADARLITTDQDTAEVAHEALIREWPTLRGWLEEDRDGLRLHRRLTEAAQEWAVLGRDPGGLYRGARLAQALEWAKAHAGEVNQLELAFLSASQSLLEQEGLEQAAQRQRELETARRLAEAERARAEEQSRATRRLRRRAYFLSLATALVGVLALAALIFWRQSVQANYLAASRELAAAAVSNLGVDPERSVLLALSALQAADTLEARNALHQAIPELHLVRAVPAHAGGVPDVAYSPDGARLATIGADGLVKVWDANSGDLLQTLDGGTGRPGSSVAFSPDGRSLAAAWVTQVVVWDLSSGRVVATLSGQSVGATVGYNLGVGQISFSPDGAHLAVANMDGAPKIWELATGQAVLSLPGESLPIKAMVYGPDGRHLATGGDEGLVRVWDAGNGAELSTLALGGIIHSVCFSADGMRLAAASEDGSVTIWEANTGQPLLSLPRLSGLYDLAFLPDGRLATAGQDGATRVWDSLTGQQLLTLAGSTSTVIGVAASPDGSRIATGAYDGSLRIWEAAPGHELTTLPAHAGIVWQVTFRPGEGQLASASVDGFVRVWDMDTGQCRLTLADSGAPVAGWTSLAYSPDGSRLAAGSLAGPILVWDSDTGASLIRLDGHTNSVVGLAFSFDGQRLASASWDGTATVWDVARGSELTTFSGHATQALVTGIAFSPDGATVFTGADDKFVYQWDAATAEIVRAFSSDGQEIYGVAVSPDGARLAAGDQDGNLHLWQVETGEKERTLAGHAGLVLRLAFNQDGSRLASAGFDRLAKVWDVEAGEELFSLYGNASNVFGVAFAPGNSQLATAGADGTVRMFTLNLDDLAALARARLTRGLAPDECRRYLHLAACPASLD